MSSRRDHHNHWEDPYAHASECSDSERDPGDEDVMYTAEVTVQPFPLAYTATATTVARQPARQEQQQQQQLQPLMYSPGSTSSTRHREQQQQPLMYAPLPPSTHPGAYPENAQTGYRFHPLDNQPPRTQYPSYSPQDMSGPRVADPRVGVGVMLDSSGSSEFFQDSQAAFDSPRTSRSTHRRTPSTPISTEHLHLPPIKELPPKPPSHHHAMEPPMPPARRNKRFRRDAVRTPDICHGRDASQKRQDHLTVLCESCGKHWQVPKTCVLMKCPNCKHVTSAMSAVAKGFSMKTNDYRFTTPRK